MMIYARMSSTIECTYVGMYAVYILSNVTNITRDFGVKKNR